MRSRYKRFCKSGQSGGKVRQREREGHWARDELRQREKLKPTHQSKRDQTRGKVRQSERGQDSITE